MRGNGFVGNEEGMGGGALSLKGRRWIQELGKGSAQQGKVGDGGQDFVLVKELFCGDSPTPNKRSPLAEGCLSEKDQKWRRAKRK